MKPRWRILTERALGAKRPRIGELLDALDEVNPTPHADLGDLERGHRYRLKGELQTRLIELFPNELALRRHADQGLLLGVRDGRDAKHVVPHQLNEVAQDWIGRELIRIDIADEPEDFDFEPAPLPARRGWSRSTA